MSVTRELPYGNCNFRVEIDRLENFAFDEVILPELMIAADEVREGSLNVPTSRKFPGRPSLTNLVLRRGFNGRLDLYQWYCQAMTNSEGAVRRVSVVLEDEQGNEVTRWNLGEAFPVRYSFTPLNGLDGSPLIETLEISCNHVQME
jgi:phage tail-like protein